MFTDTSTHQQQWNASPVHMGMHSMNTSGAYPLFNLMGYTDLASYTGIMQQEQLPSPTRIDQRTAPAVGTEEVGIGQVS